MGKPKKHKKSKNKKIKKKNLKLLKRDSDKEALKVFKNDNTQLLQSERSRSNSVLDHNNKSKEEDRKQIEIVSIEGNMGSKIEHFINFLSTHFNCCHQLQVSPTSISLQCLNDEKLKIFRKFKRDPHKWALSFLLYMLFEKSSYKRVINLSSKDKQYFIINRSIVSDYYCYALSFHELGYLTDEELLIYKNMIDSFHSYQKKAITKVIYLKSDVQKTYNRLLEKGNHMQFHILKKIHEKFTDLYNQNIKKTFNQNQNPSLLPKKDIHILNLDHYEEFNDIYNEKSKLKLYSECAKIFQIDQKEVEQTFQNNDKCSEWTTIPYKKKQKNAFYEL